MRRIADEVHLDTDEARAASTPHVMRHVLGVSLTLAILAMSAIWISSALSRRPDSAPPVTAEEHALGGYR